MLGEIFITALLAVSALFFVVDPIGLVPIYVSLTDGYSRKRRRATAAKATILFVGIVSFFAVAGSVIFRLMGVSLPAFKIAGGMLLMMTALEMLRGSENTYRTSDEEMGEATQKADVAVVPLAMPLLAGPGAIATVMVLTSRKAHVWDVAVVILAVMLVGLATFLILDAAHWLDRILGMSGRLVLERIMGLILAAIAVQFVVDGLGEALPGLSLLSGAAPAEAPPQDLAIPRGGGS